MTSTESRPATVDAHTIECHLDSYACAAENIRDSDGWLGNKWNATHAQILGWARDYRNDGLMSCPDCLLIVGDVIVGPLRGRR